MANDTIAVGSFVASNASADYTRHNCSTDQVSLNNQYTMYQVTEAKLLMMHTDPQINTTQSIALIHQSISTIAPIPENQFRGGVSTFDFDLLITVEGTASRMFQHEAEVFTTVVQIGKHIYQHNIILVQHVPAFGLIFSSDPCGSNPCTNRGTCTPSSETTFSCACAEGFSGGLCDEDLDFCTSDTCFNEGTCLEGTGTSTTCSCTEGFNGNQCEFDLNFCMLDSCLNGATCNGGVNASSVICLCVPGFTGAQCETDLDFCTPDSCSNGGTCVEGVGDFTACECAEGFTGVQCETDIDYCMSDTCLNDGTCVDGLGTSFSCNCTTGFYGQVCKTGSTTQN